MSTVGRYRRRCFSTMKGRCFMRQSFISRAGFLLATAFLVGQAQAVAPAAASDVEVTFPASAVALEADKNLGMVIDVSSYSVDSVEFALSGAIIPLGVATSQPVTSPAEHSQGKQHCKEEARSAGSAVGGVATITLTEEDTQQRHHLRC